MEKLASTLISSGHALFEVLNLALINLKKTCESGLRVDHSWLFIGPEDSGRLDLARTFAAALVCANNGCGNCSDCITCLAGAHLDVEFVNTNSNPLTVKEIREIVGRSYWAPSTSRYRVILIQDCSHLTQAAGNALLRAIEEPPTSTIWLLCASSAEDVLPTIVSRCHKLNLRAPTKKEISSYLCKKYGSSEKESDFVAQISQGDLDKAERFLRDDGAKFLRVKAFELLFNVKSEGDCVAAASELLSLAKNRASSMLKPIFEEDSKKSKTARSNDSQALVSGGNSFIKVSEEDYRSKTNRMIKENLDEFICNYLNFFRDCLVEEEFLDNSDLINEIIVTKSKLNRNGLNSLVMVLNRVRELLKTNASPSLLLELFFTQYAQGISGPNHPS